MKSFRESIRQARIDEGVLLYPGDVLVALSLNLLQRIDSFHQILIIRCPLAHFDNYTHDGNVDLYRRFGC